MTLLPKQLPCRHVTCHRHPSRPVTGFCASCLRERLSGIDPDTHAEAPVTRLAVELRRSKSHSASSAFGLAGVSREPRRRSCDVRERSSLSDLFHVDDGLASSSTRPRFKGLGFDLGIEINEDEVLGNGDEIRVSEEVRVNWEGDEGEGEFKKMKEFIDLEWERKRSKSGRYSNVGNNLLEVASVFGKKLGKWKVKQKRRNGLGGKAEEKVEKEERRSLGVGIVEVGKWRVGGKSRETQSEVGECGLGRRSCDTDPRLSVDAGVGVRLSVDNSRRSFDEPRASWDGCLIGNGRVYQPHSRLALPLVSVMEDVKLSGEEGVEETLGNVGLEKRENMNCCPGGTEQTRNYYFSGRRSFDRLGSIKRVGLGDDELKSMWNAKVSPETVGLFHGAKLLVTEKELRDSNWYAKGDDTKVVNSHPSEASFVSGGAGNKDSGLKGEQRSRSVWNMWGLIQKKKGDKCRDEESNATENVIDGQIEESLQTLRGITNRTGNGVVSQKLIRSYSVSVRDSCSTTSSNTEDKDNGNKRREELLLQRNRSMRHSPSPNNLDNGLLRFYLTPLRTYGKSKSGNSKPKNSLSLARDFA